MECLRAFKRRYQPECWRLLGQGHCELVKGLLKIVEKGLPLCRRYHEMLVRLLHGAARPLSADLEEQATDLKNQEALEAIENSEIREIRQIQEALKRISEGSYGICAHCGEDIDPKRLEALPTATKCISCAA